MQKPKEVIKEEIKWVRQSKMNRGTVSFIGKDVLIIGHGSAIHCINIKDGTEHTFRVTRPLADGVSHVNGHPTMPMFAFGEQSNSARVFIMTYPDFRKVCVLSVPHTSAGGDDKSAVRRVCSMVFSDTEHLMVLTGFPSYELEVWNWRTAKLLGAQPTGILTDMQFIKCNRAVPLTISQVSYNIGLANIWEIHTSLDTVSMIKRPIRIPGAEHFVGPYHGTHMADGSFFVLNSTLRVWSVQPVSQKVTLVIENNLFPEDAETRLSTSSKLAMLSQQASAMSVIEEDLTNKRVFLYTYRGNVSMIDWEGTLRVYKKNLTTMAWEPSFMLRSPVPFLMIAVPKDPDQQVILGVTAQGTVLCLDDQTGEKSWKVVKDFDLAFKLIAMIHPMGDVLITVTEFNRVRALRVGTGETLDTLDTNMGTVNCLQSCNTLPMFALGDDFGKVYLYSIFSGTQLRCMTTFHLSEFRITDILINNHATQLVALDESNAVFVMKGNLGSYFEITNHIQLDQHPIALTIDSNGHQFPLNITALLTPIVAPNKTYTESLLQIQVSNFNEKMVYGQLPRDFISLQWLGTNDSESVSNVFVAVPYLSNDFVVMELIKSVCSVSSNDEMSRESVDELVAEVQMTCHTHHRVNALDLQIYDDFVLTWSMGGDVEVWDKSNWSMTNRIRTMNVWAKGNKKAVTDQSMQHIITMGFEDNLQCLFNPKHTMDTNKNFVLFKKLQTKEVKDLFTKKTTGYEPDEMHTGISWVEVQRLQKRQTEYETFKNARQQCIKDLVALKGKIKALIDANEIAPDDEQLAIDEFNVDWDGITIAEQSALLERSVAENNIRKERENLTAFTEAIKAISWNQMNVKGRNIRGIFTRLKVENYSLLFPEKDKELALQKARVWRLTEQMVAQNDTFQPWVPFSMEELVAVLASHPECSTPRNPESMGGGDSNEGMSKTMLAPKNQYTLTGTSSHVFIKPIPLRYTQLEVVTYYQMHLENILGYHDTLALRKYFNTKFDEMSAVKESELQLARQRNERLRHIQSEMNKLEELKNSGVYHERDIIDPEFSADEKPARIVTVEPHELTITPYISPSEQDLLDAAAAEAERRRLALLADDFRERALMKMMNGVLEIRWEDEIKKTPPAPACILSGKDPKDYTPEDLSLIFEWENEIKFLESERERYRVMLVTEQAKVDQTIDDQYRKFNLKVGTGLMEKIQVEFAIASEDLKLLRNEQYHFQRYHLAGMERTLSSELREIREQISEYTANLNALEDKLTLIKTKYEEMVQKDRLLDRHFKTSYGEVASKPIVDQAFRIYKRRPKWQIRAWQTPTILNDMAKRIVSFDSTHRGPPLPDECFSFLQNLDNLDKPNNAPNVFDAHQWQVLCKMRRVKLEMEIRLRSLGGQVAEAESTVNGYVREINSKKASAVVLEQRIVDVVKERRAYVLNRSVQISMKRGIVEIPLSGHLTDFDNSILLHSSDVHDINEIIKKAGLKKLKTMQHAALFRRKITLKEWEHEVLRTRIREKTMQIKCIQKTKITKEVQLWLKYKQMGWKDDISDQALTREVEACRRSMQIMCNEIIAKINETEAEIVAKKRTNAHLDKRINSMNLHVLELNLARNVERETRISESREIRLKMMVDRSRLVRAIQLNHAKILELCTVLELQRLRTFPTLNVNSLQDLE